MAAENYGESSIHLVINLKLLPKLVTRQHFNDRQMNFAAQINSLINLIIVVLISTARGRVGAK